MIYTKTFENQLLNQCFYGRNPVDTPENLIVVRRAFDLALRNLPKDSLESTIFHEVSLYVRIGYKYLLNWC